MGKKYSLATHNVIEMALKVLQAFRNSSNDFHSFSWF